MRRSNTNRAMVLAVAAVAAAFVTRFGMPAGAQDRSVAQPQREPAVAAPPVASSGPRADDAAREAVAPADVATPPDGAATPPDGAANASAGRDAPPAGSAGAGGAAAGEAATGGEPAMPQPAVIVAAKELFGAVKSSAPLQARAIGSYAKGCLAGAKALPVDGPNWQAMRLSRNRNWGHPELVQLIERFADEAWRYEGWQGMLVGDMAQPRGGPMLTGHASHQIGLDADIWLTPMPPRRLSTQEREDLAATSMLAADEISVDAKVFTPTHAAVLKRAASYDKVERVLVHPAIKKALCESAGSDRGWLSKVRPYFGHHYHFHVRIACPQGSDGCTPQKPVPGDDGCKDELTHWIKLVTPKPPAQIRGIIPPPKPTPPERPLTLDQLPDACRTVLSVGKPGVPGDLLAKQKAADAALAEARKAHAAKLAAAKAAAAAKAPAKKPEGTAATAAGAAATTPHSEAGAPPADPGRNSSVSSGGQ